MAKGELPGWAKDPVASVREQAERYRHMTPTERAMHLLDACDAAAQLLALNKHRARLLARRDPLPESTVAALARLRSRRRG
jgi:hypothetical protein